MKRKPHKTAPRTPNPATGRTVPLVTDRALRYRAARNPPEGPELCAYCGAGGRMDIEHIDGHEENTEPANLLYACRRCNVQKGLAFQDEGIGRITRQYNPAARRPAAAVTLRDWKAAVSSLMGGGPWTPKAAVKTVQRTTAAKRATFARALAARRTRNPGAPSSYAYMAAIQILRGNMAGDKKKARETIDATPASQRSQWTRAAWRTRKEVYGPSGRAQTSFLDDVPF